MIRFICFLLGKSYESCKSCETLKQQLEFVNSEKKELTDTLLRIISPRAVEAPPVEINQIQATSALFSRRRAAMEAKDREDAKILAEKRFVGVPDDKIKSFTATAVTSNVSGNISTIQALEKELGVTEEGA